MAYLPLLTLRLTATAMQLPDEVRRAQAAWLAAAQRPDGGFAGREGDSDLYYTGFGLRGLALVGALGEEQARAAAEFLRRSWREGLPSIDFLSLLQSAVLLETLCDVPVLTALGVDRATVVAQGMAPFRRDDGGWSKSLRSGASSTYHTFLTVVCLELLGQALPDPDALVRLIRGRQRADGGFAELGPLRQGGTNPTAAAVALLAMLKALDEPIRTPATRFLASMQNMEGGLRANGQIPVADLLSTCTGLVALLDLDASQTIDRAAALRYVRAQCLPTGGFRAGIWDQTADVEYTFYGLAALALLSADPSTPLPLRS